jgi:hypothetical protein
LYRLPLLLLTLFVPNAIMLLLLLLLLCDHPQQVPLSAVFPNVRKSPLVHSMGVGVVR